MNWLTRLAPLALLGLPVLGCRSEPGVDDEVGASEETTSADTTATTSADTTTATSDDTTSGGDEIVGLDLMTRLAGLWTGPATMTPLGTFEPMNMDLRAADGHMLFSRADLDAENSLRFGFVIETHGGQDVLVYRNGGYFQGVLRDSRTALVEHVPVDAQGQGSWRFCSVTAEGCNYIDARFELDDADHLVFDVKVKGQQHVYWLAERIETREVLLGEGDTRRMLDGPHALVLGNIRPSVLIPCAADILDLLAPGGTAVLSGILIEEGDEVRAAYPSLRETSRPRENDWVALVLEREAP